MYSAKTIQIAGSSASTDCEAQPASVENEGYLYVYVQLNFYKVKQQQCREVGVFLSDGGCSGVQPRRVPVSTATSWGHSPWVTSQRLQQALLRHRPFPPGDPLKPQSRDLATPTPSEGLGSEICGVPGERAGPGVRQGEGRGARRGRPAARRAGAACPAQTPPPRRLPPPARPQRSPGDAGRRRRGPDRAPGPPLFFFSFLLLLFLLRLRASPSLPQRRKWRRRGASVERIDARSALRSSSWGGGRRLPPGP